MATTITEEKPFTEEDARETMRWIVQQIEEAQERMQATKAEIARLKAESTLIKAESAEIMHEIRTVVTRLKAIG
jgi:uncharacterized protein involved in exopolysaccharide biosynthesis